MRKKISMLSAVLNGLVSLEGRGFFSDNYRPKRTRNAPRQRARKPTTQADFDRLGAAEEKRLRKNAKRAHDGVTPSRART